MLYDGPSLPRELDHFGAVMAVGPRASARALVPQQQITAGRGRAFRPELFDQLDAGRNFFGVAIRQRTEPGLELVGRGHGQHVSTMCLTAYAVKRIGRGLCSNLRQGERSS